MCQLALNSLKNQKKEKSISDLLVMVLPERVTKIFSFPPPFPLFLSDAPPFKAVFLWLPQIPPVPPISKKMNGSLGENCTSIIHLFADDTLIYSTIEPYNAAGKLQLI